MKLCESHLGISGWQDGLRLRSSHAHARSLTLPKTPGLALLWGQLCLLFGASPASLFGPLVPEGMGSGVLLGTLPGPLVCEAALLGSMAFGRFACAPGFCLVQLS
jgi:hypothetical protein